jgi:CelD/BcsL family acetyltransferase involved in cellulose biosynthesis
VNDLDTALKDAALVTGQSYQDALGVGLRDTPEHRGLLSTAAHNGWLRLSLMHIDGEPCAYQLGLVYHGTYLLDKIAFSSEWGNWNVGTVLFLRILEELCDDPQVTSLDFGFGEAYYKRSYSDTEWEEVSLYVFARRLRPYLLGGTCFGIGAVNSAVRSIFKKLGLAGSVKRLWRRRLSSRQSAGDGKKR